MMTLGKYGSANARWAGLGPYHAMFPSTFADNVIARYSETGDTVLDPFAGRGTALFSAVSAGRKALGIEVNPVGWIYSKTKLGPAPKEDVYKRIAEVEDGSTDARRLDPSGTAKTAQRARRWRTETMHRGTRPALKKERRRPMRPPHPASSFLTLVA
jgi:hypothetical protein